MDASLSVWIVDDDKSIRWVLEKALAKAEIQTRSFSDAQTLLSELKSPLPSAVITDIRMPGMDGLELLERLHSHHPQLPIIVTTAHADLDNAVSAYHGGAFEYLPKPFDVEEVMSVVERALAQSRTRPGPASLIQDQEPVPEIIGSAPAMQEVFRAIGRLARSNITVLINGESGTGKELVAKALHRHSPRFAGPFIALNMAAIPRDLLESELFGHEKGAFTGAQGRRQGRFQQADGGTLFLDEIGDMPAELQTRLLRVLAEGQFYPIGAHAPVQVDVRIIAATHQNLESLVTEGRFREDLFHRLNVIRIHLPALRERRDDIPLLARYFLKRVAVELNTEVKQLSRAAEAKLKECNWPGNVRQLENTCRWLTVMALGQEIHADELPAELSTYRPEPTASNVGWQNLLALEIETLLSSQTPDIARRVIADVETMLIEQALRHCRGKRIEAAKLLGYGRNTITRKCKELGLDD